jgi:hypothetical protein
MSLKLIKAPIVLGVLCCSYANPTEVGKQVGFNGVVGVLSMLFVV